MKIQLPSPPAVITMNHRGGVKEKRGFSPEGFKRFNAMLSRIATEHNLEFRIATFEHQSFEQQIRIMQSSGIVVGLHGANMMNAIFLPPLSSLLEIFPVFYYVSTRASTPLSAQLKREAERRGEKPRKKETKRPRTHIYTACSWTAKFCRFLPRTFPEPQSLLGLVLTTLYSLIVTSQEGTVDCSTRPWREMTKM